MKEYWNNGMMDYWVNNTVHFRGRCGMDVESDGFQRNNPSRSSANPPFPNIPTFPNFTIPFFHFVPLCLSAFEPLRKRISNQN